MDILSFFFDPSTRHSDPQISRELFHFKRQMESLKVFTEISWCRSSVQSLHWARLAGYKHTENVLFIFIFFFTGITWTATGTPHVGYFSPSIHTATSKLWIRDQIQKCLWSHWQETIFTAQWKIFTSQNDFCQSRDNSCKVYRCDWREDRLPLLPR